MTRLLPLVLSASPLLACDAPTYSDDPPEIGGVVLDCADDLFSATVMASDANEVTNVTIDVATAGTLVSTWYPLKDLDYSAGTSTWVATDEPLGCDGGWDLLVTATNLWGHSATADASWPDAEVGLDGVDPPWGSDAGGSVVTVTGDGLDAADGIAFDGYPATILGTTAEGVAVSTPAGSPGTVDVTVQSGSNTTTLPQSFTYFPDATGLVTAIARPSIHLQTAEYFAIGSPYTTLPSYDPFLQLDMIWHEPVPPQDSFLGAHPEPGSCEWGAAAYETVDVGSFVYGHGDRSGTFVIPETGADSNVYAYVLGNVDLVEWPGQHVTLEVAQEDALPLVALEDALVFVDLLADPSFDWTTANETVRGDDFAASWTPDGLVEGVAYRIYPATSPGNGAETLGALECTADATGGELRLTWDELVGGLTDPADESRIESLYTELSFYVNTRTVMAHDNSEFWSRGELRVWVYWDVVEPPADSGLDTGAP